MYNKFIEPVIPGIAIPQSRMARGLDRASMGIPSGGFRGFGNPLGQFNLSGRDIILVALGAAGGYFASRYI